MVKTYGEIQDEKVIDPLYRILTIEEHPEVREEAIEVLCQWIEEDFQQIKHFFPNIFKKLNKYEKSQVFETLPESYWEEEGLSVWTLQRFAIQLETKFWVFMEQGLRPSATLRERSWEQGRGKSEEGSRKSKNNPVYLIVIQSAVPVIGILLVASWIFFPSNKQQGKCFMVYGTKNYLPVRDHPDLNYPEKAPLENGGKVTVIGKPNSGFYKITTPIKGWVVAKYLKECP
ncbi:MAG: SH3 domain-containing protein [Moorea sp. SIO2I5]|nr:SH3 domain-containing protein [Moorena sp. SIO2I5]